MIKVRHLDHLVLTVKDIERTCRFYHSLLGMQVITYDGQRKALQFGHQKINLHQVGEEFTPHAKTTCPGSADLCFMCNDTAEKMHEILRQNNVPIEAGIVTRTGAMGTIKSLYIRDPDGNLLELSTPASAVAPVQNSR